MIESKRVTVRVVCVHMKDELSVSQLFLQLCDEAMKLSVNLIYQYEGLCCSQLFDL